MGISGNVVRDIAGVEISERMMAYAPMLHGEYSASGNGNGCQSHYDSYYCRYLDKSEVVSFPNLIHPPSHLRHLS